MWLWRTTCRCHELGYVVVQFCMPFGIHDVYAEMICVVVEGQPVGDYSTLESLVNMETRQGSRCKLT
jgi:hypothetical protein